MVVGPYSKTEPWSLLYKPDPTTTMRASPESPPPPKASVQALFHKRIQQMSVLRILKPRRYKAKV